MLPEIKIENRIWIEKNGQAFIGSGRITLLELIHETGSISKAAKKMGMSYKKAWTLIKSMNSQAETILVKKVVGGKNGGGTLLTQRGHNIVRQFRELERKSEDFLTEEMKNCCIN